MHVFGQVKNIDSALKYLKIWPIATNSQGTFFLLLFKMSIHSIGQDSNVFLWPAFAGWISFLVWPLWRYTSPRSSIMLPFYANSRLWPCALCAMQFRSQRPLYNSDTQGPQELAYLLGLCSITDASGLNHLKWFLIFNEVFLDII